MLHSRHCPDGRLSDVVPTATRGILRAGGSSDCNRIQPACDEHQGRSCDRCNRRASWWTNPRARRGRQLRRTPRAAIESGTRSGNGLACSTHAKPSGFDSSSGSNGADCYKLGWLVCVMVLSFVGLSGPRLSRSVGALGTDAEGRSAGLKPLAAAKMGQGPRLQAALGGPDCGCQHAQWDMTAHARDRLPTQMTARHGTTSRSSSRVVDIPGAKTLKHTRRCSTDGKGLTSAASRAIIRLNDISTRGREDT